MAESILEQERSATYGMGLADRILHIGGRENAQTYIEFGSVEAVGMLIAQVLRDLPGGAPGFELAFAKAVARTTPGLPAVPAGWKLVPVEPSEKMQRAMAAQFNGTAREAMDAWAEALAAAPDLKEGAK